MQENQDKKISYKILTAEELLKEEFPPTREIEHKEEKIEVPVVQKIEDQKEVTVKKEKVKERKEVIEPESKIEAGLIYPEAEKEEEPIEKVIIEPPQKVEISIPRPTEIVPPEIKPIKEEPPKEEIFYVPQKEEIPFRSKPELLQKEFERKEIPEREFKLPANLLRFVFLGGGVILIFLLILFLKPQEKFKAIFKAKEEKKEEEIKIRVPTETVILFPTTSAPTTAPEISTQLQVPSQREVIARPEVEYVSQEIKFLTQFPSKNVNLRSLDFSNWQEELRNFFSYQDYAGTQIVLNFTYLNKKIPFNFLFDYFIKPTRIPSNKIEEFKNNLTGSYGFLIYYGPTRKYPILIFEAKDKEKALKFNQEWEKLTMKEDLKTLFLGLKPPKTKNKFLPKKYKKYSYRILDFGDNFKIIWSIADNYIIYSSTETGIKKIFDSIK
jgi:hypothetical protein